MVERKNDAAPKAQVPMQKNSDIAVSKSHPPAVSGRKELMERPEAPLAGQGGKSLMRTEDASQDKDQSRD